MRVIPLFERGGGGVAPEASPLYFWPKFRFTVDIISHKTLTLRSCATHTHKIYYPPEVRRGNNWGLGVFLWQYFLLISI